MYSFEVTDNQKTPNGIKMISLQYGYLRFLIFWDLTPKFQNVNFSKIFSYKAKIFKLSENREYMLSRYILTTRMQNFKSISLFFCATAKKQTRDDGTYLNVLIGIYNSRR